jgi:hypothetical protein
MPIAKIITNGHSSESEADYDASLIFTDGNPTAESLNIILEAKKHSKAYLHINIRASDHEDTVRDIGDWLEGNGNNDYGTYQAVPAEHCRLNVAINKGSRPSDIDSIVMQILVEILRKVNPECRNFFLNTEQP